MSDALTLAAAEDLAARTLAAIGWQEELLEGRIGVERVAADRERIESDLAGLRGHASIVQCHDHVGEWPCDDARRYSEGLLRTAALYGVVP